MPMDPNEIQAAIEAIETAFAGLTLPSDDKLLHPQCMDDGDIKDFYGGPKASALPDEMIIGNYAAPSFFSAEAFQYYMPAFMLWALRHPDTVEYAPESTLHALDPAATGTDLHAFQVSKYALFTDAQRRAVIAFLRAFSRDADLGPIAESALANHWNARD